MLLSSDLVDFFFFLVETSLWEHFFQLPLICLKEIFQGFHWLFSTGIFCFSAQETVYSRFPQELIWFKM